MSIDTGEGVRAVSSSPARRRVPLYGWVLLGMAVGVTLGLLAPDVAVQFKFLGDAFVKLLRMLVSPIVFVMVVLGFAGMKTLGSAGRIGAKTLIYFEVVSTLALITGLVAVNVFKPGAGMNVDPATLDVTTVEQYVRPKSDGHQWLLDIIPVNLLNGVAGSDLLQTLVVAVLCGVVVSRMGSRAEPVVHALQAASEVLLGMLSIVMRLAPLGVAGAMAFTIGKFGAGTLQSLVHLMAVFYLTCIVFIVAVLGSIARLAGFNIFRLIRHLRDELLTALGTASSESVLAPLMAKLERLGCSRGVVGLVIPSGFSFNMDGGSIYLTLSVVFLAQALGIDLTLGHQLAILGVALVTSKGSSGVAGSGFIILASTLAVVPDIPVASLALLLGVDRFMSEARVLTNLVGNAVATLVIARHEGDMTGAELAARLAAGGNTE